MADRADLKETASQLGMLVECWRSDDNLEEIHYFLNELDGATPTYICGFNPDIFTEAEMTWLATLGLVELRNHRAREESLATARDALAAPKF